MILTQAHKTTDFVRSIDAIEAAAKHGRLCAEAQVAVGATYRGPLPVMHETGYEPGSIEACAFRDAFMSRKAELTHGCKIVTDSHGRVLGLAD